MTKALLQQALDALEHAQGNINPERGFADEAEADITTAITALREALAAPQAEPAPGDMVMVPREPTPEMLAVVRNGPMCETWTAGYRAMIAAAPAPAVPLTAQPVAWAKQQKKKLRITHMDMHGEEGWRPLVFGDAAVRSAAPVDWVTPHDVSGAPWQDVAPAVPNLRHCACEFDGDTCVSQCKLHAAHVAAIHEWAERAKSAEAKQSAAPAVPLTDEQFADMVADASLAVDLAASPIKLLAFARAVLSAAPVVREPLTSAEIYKLWAENTERSYCEQVQYFARLVERKHGIGGGNGR